MNIKEIENDIVKMFSYTEEDCLYFLRNNYGLRGVNNTAFTYNNENRNLNNMRLECISQYLHNLKTIKKITKNRVRATIKII